MKLNCACLKDPTPAMVKAGYNLEVYTRKGLQYLQHALHCIDVAVQEAKDLGEDVNLLDLVNERQMILKQMQLTLQAQKIHKILDDRLKGAGYRKVTDKDFEVYGAGGRR